jgi:SET domain-containing protein|tara:strand:+ start:180 stop:482 length:303 start_codon:yes stop_codon:yes gene_type:complete
MKYYRPLPDCLTIKESEIEGLGLTAKSNIVKDTNLGISHVYHVDFNDNYIRTPLGGFVNYSDNPNCKVFQTVDGYELYTIKDIKSGEELTLKYNLYNPTK